MLKKKIIRFTFVVSILGAAIWVGTRLPTNAESDQIVAGSVNDPVVTKSYVDKQLSSIANGDNGNNSSSTLSVEVVTVPLGKRLIAKDGAEFVVRAGKAIAYSSDANGISDLTDGVDITNGKSVPNNHLILFPRGGRGVQAAEGQKSGLTVLVRGDYELQQQ